MQGSDIVRAGTKTSARGTVKGPTARAAVGSMVESAPSHLHTGVGGKAKNDKPKVEKTEEEKELKELQKDIKAFLV